MPVISKKKERRYKKDFKNIEEETEEVAKFWINLIHFIIGIVIIGLFSYWCYLIQDLFKQTEAENVEAVTLDIGKTDTIFHLIVLMFFIYIIFLSRNSLDFTA